MSYARLLGKPQSNGEPSAVDSSQNAVAWTDGHALRRRIPNPFLDRFFRKMIRDQRRHPRLISPPLIAYLGNSGSSKPFAIADVSIGGFCIRADEFWSPGTVLTITLQGSYELTDGTFDSITVPAMVVRRAEGAAGFAVALASEQAVMFPGFRVKQACNVHEQMESFLKRLKTPVFQPPTLITHGAPAFPILNREQRLSLLLESARNHKLSQAWDEEVEEEPAHIPASSYIEI